MMLDLLTNAIVVDDDAIRFVSHKPNIKKRSHLRIIAVEMIKNNEPDYDDEDEVLLEEEAAELTSAVTTNQIF
jgi:hypothetical protein